MAEATWSGQPAEKAYHWGDETCQRLGDVIYLLCTGKAEDREKAYQSYIELKRWFIPGEFDHYIDTLDKFRKRGGFTPLSEIMQQIKRERGPATHWKALDGEPQGEGMLPEMRKSFTFYQLLTNIIRSCYVNT